MSNKDTRVKDTATAVMDDHDGDSRVAQLVLDSSENVQLLNEFKELVESKVFNDDDLHDYIRIFLGYDIPRENYCTHHCAPFDMVADGFFGRYPNNGAVGFAARGTGKTLNVAIIHNALMVLRSGVDIAHFGAVERQAKKCYEYFIDFASEAYFKDLFNRTNISDAGTTEGSKLLIAPGTPASVSGPHPHFLSFDEIELVKDWERTIEKSFGCTYSDYLMTGTSLYTSTRDEVGGMMDKMLKRGGRAGYGLYCWCIFDVVERCPAHRECKDCPPLTQERCFDPTKTLFHPDTGEPCGRCKFTNGHYPLQDFIAKSSAVSEGMWVAQYLCGTPMKTGAVYKEFDRSLHVAPKRLQFKKEWRNCIFMDYGFVDPFVWLWVQIDPSDRVYVMRELRWIGYTTEEIIAEVKQMAHATTPGMSRYVPLDDIEFVMGQDHPEAARTIRKRFKDRGWKQRKFKKSEVVDDIPLMREFLKVRGDGLPGMIFSPDCVGPDDDELGVIEEMEYLRFKKPGRRKNPTSEQEDYRDHGPEAVRNGLKALYKKRFKRTARAGGKIGVEQWV